MTTLDRALAHLRERAEEDAAFAALLADLADAPDESTDPFARAPDTLATAARAANARRQGALPPLTGLTSAEVAALLPSLSDRRGVDRRRARGALYGFREGRRVLHPAWQFDRANRRVRPGVPEVVAVLAEVAATPRRVATLMESPRDELDGRTLADLVADGEVGLVVALLRRSADQS